MRRHAVILAAALAWLISVETAEARLEILVEKATQRMVVIQNGYMRYIWPVSTGRDELATPNGIYMPQRLERTWFSTAYYNSPMPYSIFFYNGYAIHGSYAIDRLGGPASHGCVRLHPHHAALLFGLVQQEGKENTRIEVTDEPRLDGPPPVPPGEVDAGRGPPVDMGRGPGPREFDVGRGPRDIDMARGPGPREFDVGRGPRDIDMARGPGPREFDMGRGPRDIDMARGPGPREFDMAREPRVIYAGRGPGEIDAGRGPPAIDPGQGLSPPPPKIARYRDPPSDLADVIAQRGNRPPAARLALSQKPPPAPAGRRTLIIGLGAPPATQPANQSATAPRAPCDGANGSDSADCRPKPRSADGKSADGKAAEAKAAEARAAEARAAEAKAAEGHPPEQAQQPKQMYGMKVLPASCWSGGASRWRWWGSGQEAQCKQ